MTSSSINSSGNGDGDYHLHIDNDREYHDSSSLSPSPSYVSSGRGRVHAQSVSDFGSHFEPSLKTPYLPETLTRQQVIESAKHFRQLEPMTNTRLRWNLLWNVTIWILFTLPITLPYLIGCVGSFYAIIGVLTFFNLIWAFAIFFTAYYILYLYNGMNRDYKQDYSPEDQCYHIIILTIYKDDMDVVMRTIGSLAKQTEAKRLVLTLGWEGRTPDREARTEQIKAAFSDSFHLLLFSAHPYQLPNEIASKAANANWALRYATRFLFEKVGHSELTHFMCTTCDSDTLFHERYFESLTSDYLKMLKAGDKKVHKTIWQAPLFYNWNLDQSSFITRVTGLLRTTMTTGLMIPYSVNPMSCFSFSLTLGIRGGYWHPQVFMDDVGFLLMAQIGVQQRVTMRCLPIPVLSGPTSGATWYQDMKEWYVQVRRWAIGTSDNFHIMVTNIKNLPLSTAIVFNAGYFLYYGVILCVGPLFSTTSTCFYGLICKDSSESVWNSWGGLNWLSSISIGGHSLTPNQFILFLSFLPYIFYGMMFLLDSIWIRVILHIKEDINIFRNIAHWLSVGPCMLAYSLTQLHGYNVIAVKGKIGACVHQLAGKATLGTGQGLHGNNAAAAASSTNMNSLSSESQLPRSSTELSERLMDEQFH